MVADCLFCEPGNPCPQHAGKTKKRASRKQAQPTEVVESTVSIEPFEPVQRRSRFATNVEKPQVTQDELEFREAVRNLFPILSPQERMKYESIVNPPKTPHQARMSAEVRRALDANESA